MNSFGKIVAATALAMTFGSGAAYADGCSGRDHTTETVVGAGVGALAGGLIGGDIAGAAVGGVAGGFLGNYVGRQQDCSSAQRNANARRAAAARQAADNRGYYVDRNGNRHYYNRR